MQTRNSPLAWDLTRRQTSSQTIDLVVKKRERRESRVGQTIIYKVQVSDSQPSSRFNNRTGHTGIQSQTGTFPTISKPERTSIYKKPKDRGQDN